MSSPPRHHRLLPAIILMVAGAPLSQASEAAEGQWLLPAHEVGEQVVAANNRAWRSGFDLEVTEAAVLVRVHIHLLPGEDVGRARLDRLAEDWEPQAESLWSDRYGVRIGPDRTLPIRLDVRFRGPGIHHRIIVQNGVARADQLHWGTRSTGQTVAHEIGHMLGAFDEYPGGGTNPAGAVIDESSIMWSQPTRGLSRARHYESVRKALIGAWGRTDLELVALPSTGG